MVMVSSGTHLVKNNEFLSQKRSPKLKMIGPLCKQQLFNPETDAKPLYYSLLKLKYSPSIYLKHKKDKICIFLKTTATEIPRTGYYTKESSSNRSIVLCVLQDTFHELFCVFGDFYASGTQDAEETKSRLSKTNKMNSFYCLGTNITVLLKMNKKVRDNYG